MITPLGLSVIELVNSWPAGRPDMTAERFEVIRIGERDPIPSMMRTAIYRRDWFRCSWCGATENLELDHLKPWSAGGGDTPANLRTLCHDCNAMRSNRNTEPGLVLMPIAAECPRCYPEGGCDEERLMVECFCLGCNKGRSGFEIRWTMARRGQVQDFVRFCRNDERRKTWALEAEQRAMAVLDAEGDPDQPTPNGAVNQ